MARAVAAWILILSTHLFLCVDGLRSPGVAVNALRSFTGKAMGATGFMFDQTAHVRLVPRIGATIPTDWDISTRGTFPQTQSPSWDESMVPGASLLYMNCYKWQESFIIDKLCGRRVDLSEELSLQVSEEREGRIGSAMYETDQFRKIRMTYFDAGDKVQVFNSLWYPRTEFNAPVLGVDLLCFGMHKILAVIDCQPLLDKSHTAYHNAFSEPFVPIRQKYPSLCGQMSNRYYDQNQFFSKAMLFGRFEETSSIDAEVYPALQDYVQTYLDVLDGVSANFEEESKRFVQEQQDAYDQYSAERDPAHALFKSYFGEKWADDYMYEFLFEGSERP